MTHQCQHCKRIGEPSYRGVGPSDLDYDLLAYCPACGCESLIEVVACDCCHAALPGEGLDQCEPCFAVIEAHQSDLVRRYNAAVAP